MPRSINWPMASNEFILRPCDRSHAGGFSGHRHQFGAFDRYRTVFAINQDPVESELSDDFDDVRRRDHYGYAERRLAVRAIYASCGWVSCRPPSVITVVDKMLTMR